MKVRAFKLDGYELFFHTKESGSEPPHFHITRTGERWKLKILFEDCTETHLEFRVKPLHFPGNPLPRNKATELRQRIDEYRDSLLEQWEEIIGGQ